MEKVDIWFSDGMYFYKVCEKGEHTVSTEVLELWDNILDQFGILQKQLLNLDNDLQESKLCRNLIDSDERMSEG